MLFDISPFGHRMVVCGEQGRPKADIGQYPLKRRQYWDQTAEISGTSLQQLHILEYTRRSAVEPRRPEASRLP